LEGNNVELLNGGNRMLEADFAYFQQKPEFEAVETKVIGDVIIQEAGVEGVDD
jgi:hypothetical protein